MPVIRISEELFQEIQKYAEPLVDNVETAIWKAIGKQRTINNVISRKPKTKAFGELTSPIVFRRIILETLVKHGGMASRLEVHDDIRNQMVGSFKPGDTERNSDGTLKWEKRVDFLRLSMVNEGLLKEESPRGIWEISDRGKLWLSKNKPGATSKSSI